MRTGCRWLSSSSMLVPGNTATFDNLNWSGVLLSSAAQITSPYMGAKFCSENTLSEYLQVVLMINRPFYSPSWLGATYSINSPELIK